MKFVNDCRGEITIYISHEFSNQPEHTVVLKPHENAERVSHMNTDIMTVHVVGGGLYSGEDKSFTSLQLQRMHEGLDEALNHVRSKEARDSIEEVIEMIGW